MITQTGPNAYIVQSRDIEGKSYLTRPATGCCSCRYNGLTGQECEHLREVRAELDKGTGAGSFRFSEEG